MTKRAVGFLTCVFALICLFLTACSDAKQDEPLRDATPKVLMPEASGTKVLENDLVTLDISNTDEGYFMLWYGGDAEKVKAILTAPDGEKNTVSIEPEAVFHTLPLTWGNGIYSITVYENIPDENRDDLYSAVFSGELEVSGIDEFKPFLYPNQYVNFTSSSMVVQKGSELASGCHSQVEALTNIYNYVINNIEYDTSLAESVSFGYIPDPDRTLESGKGICFDYAALMAAMLRSQSIPAKLEVGYSGEALHAWISAYLQDIGWVEKIIQFTGSEWKILDPTLGAANDSEQVSKYIGDGSHYLMKYLY